MNSTPISTNIEKTFLSNPFASLSCEKAISFAFRDFSSESTLSRGSLNCQFPIYYSGKREEISDAEFIDTCEQRLAEISDMFTSCLGARELFERVQEKGSISTSCTTTKEAPNGGRCYPDTREIVFSKAAKNIGPIILFELNNLDQSKTFLSITENACKMLPEDFALRIEKIEYNTVKRTHEIAAKCVKQGIWPAEWDVYKDQFSGKLKGWSTFEEYLATQESTGHTNLYRKDWHAICNPKTSKAIEKNK